MRKDIVATVVLTALATVIGTSIINAPSSAENNPGVVTIENCLDVHTIQVVDADGQLVGVGTRVQQPPYVCQFVFSPSTRH